MSKEKKFFCKICTSHDFKMKNHLQRHINFHTIAEVECKICNKMIITSYELKRHLKKVHKKSREIGKIQLNHTNKSLKIFDE